MMCGAGRFLHRENYVMDTNFCNNLADNGDHFVCPFFTKDERADYVSRIARRAVDEQKAKCANLDTITVHRAHNADELQQIIFKVRANYRTPLVVSTFENPIGY